MSDERERRYLAHIAESIHLIDDYVRDGRPAFLEQRQVQDAVLRRLQILADAAGQLSPELKDRHRDIPWREVYGFRNIAAHAYLDIDLERVWEIVTDHLPAGAFAERLYGAKSRLMSAPRVAGWEREWPFRCLRFRSGRRPMAVGVRLMP